jgi:hypothetical protein
MVDGTTFAPKASVPPVPFNGFATCVPFTAQPPPGEATVPMTATPQVRTQGERTHSGWRIKAAELAWVVLNGPHTKILQGRTAVEIAQQYANNQLLQVNYNEVHSRCRQPWLGRDTRVLIRRCSDVDDDGLHTVIHSKYCLIVSTSLSIIHLFIVLYGYVALPEHFFQWWCGIRIVNDVVLLL